MSETVATYWVKYRGTRFPIRRGETILGRSPYCSIVISNSLVSREHCALRLHADSLRVVDLNSTNGITLNGERVHGSAGLEPGDLLGVGTEVLELLRTEHERETSTTRGTELTRDDMETLARSDTLELVEALVASASESSDPRRVATTIQRALDQLVEQRPSDAAVRGRLAAAALRVAAWYPDGKLDPWRDRLLARIQPGVEEHA